MKMESHGAGSEILRIRGQINESMREIEELLGDIAEADADACWQAPAVPIEAIPDRILQLARRLRLMFDLEDSQWYVSEDTDALDETEALREQHDRVLVLLEEVCELAGSSIQPASTWNDVESHFRRFERMLTDHQRLEDQFRQQAALTTADR
jgi:hypothetical protein